MHPVQAGPVRLVTTTEAFFWGLIIGVGISLFYVWGTIPALGKAATKEITRRTK